MNTLKKLKLLFITHTHSSGGGAEKILTTLANNLDTEKYEISIFELLHYDIKNEPLHNNIKLLPPMMYIQQKRIPFYEYTLNQLLISNPAVIKALHSFEDYDIVISWITGFPSYLASAFDNYKIAWNHNDITYLLNTNNFPDIEFEKQLQGYVWNSVSKILSVSNMAANSIINVFPQFKDRAEIFYNPVDIDNIIKYSDEKIDDTACLSSNSLIAIGRLDSNKNFELLLEVQKKLCDENIKSHLVLLGTGVQENLLKRKSISLGIQNSVSFLGFKENPYPYLRNSKLLCLSSFSEGFPTVICEAMTLGKPFVTTPVAGASDELSCDGKCGFVSDWNAENFATQVKKILLDEQLYHGMSENCIKKITEFSIANAVVKFDNEIAEVNAGICLKTIQRNLRLTLRKARSEFMKSYIYAPLGYKLKIKKSLFRLQKTPGFLNCLKLFYRISEFILYVLAIPIRLFFLIPIIKLLDGQHYMQQ